MTQNLGHRSQRESSLEPDHKRSRLTALVTDSPGGRSRSRSSSTSPVDQFRGRGSRYVLHVTVDVVVSFGCTSFFPF